MRCGDCGKLVRLDKPLVGSLHICITACEREGYHLEPTTRRCGPLWARRTEHYCAACGDRL